MPFFDDDEEEGDDEDDDEEEEEEDDAGSVPETEYISESSHIWAKTWQIPSSTSGLRLP